MSRPNPFYNSSCLLLMHQSFDEYSFNLQHARHSLIDLISLVLSLNAFLSCLYCSSEVHLRVSPILRYSLDNSYWEWTLTFHVQDIWLSSRQANAVLTYRRLPLTVISLLIWKSGYFPHLHLWIYVFSWIWAIALSQSWNLYLSTW